MEEDRHYNDACLDIFEDVEQEKLFPIEIVVDNFRKIFLEVVDDKDIQQAFRIEEVLLELDTKLRDFVDTQIEVDNYKQNVKEKYEALDILDVAKIVEMIEKFNGRHPNIALG